MSKNISNLKHYDTNNMRIDTSSQDTFIKHDLAKLHLTTKENKERDNKIHAAIMKYSNYTGANNSLIPYTLQYALLNQVKHFRDYKHCVQSMNKFRMMHDTPPRKYTDSNKELFIQNQYDYINKLNIARSTLQHESADKDISPQHDIKPYTTYTRKSHKNVKTIQPYKNIDVLSPTYKTVRINGNNNVNTVIYFLLKYYPHLIKQDYNFQETTHINAKINDRAAARFLASYCYNMINDDIPNPELRYYNKKSKHTIDISVILYRFFTQHNYLPDGNILNKQMAESMLPCRNGAYMIFYDIDQDILKDNSIVLERRFPKFLDKCSSQYLSVLELEQFKNKHNYDENNPIFTRTDIYQQQENELL